MNRRTLLLVIELIDLARLAATQGVDTVQRFEAHRDIVRRLIAENREPDADERAALADDLEALQRRLHAP